MFPSKITLKFVYAFNAPQDSSLLVQETYVITERVGLIGDGETCKIT